MAQEGAAIGDRGPFGSRMLEENLQGELNLPRILC